MIYKPKSTFIYPDEYIISGAGDGLCYMAVTEIPCGGCANVIQKDEFFSRYNNKNCTVAGIRYTRCRQCRPFNMEKNLRYPSFLA